MVKNYGKKTLWQILVSAEEAEYIASQDALETFLKGGIAEGRNKKKENNTLNIFYYYYKLVKTFHQKLKYILSVMFLPSRKYGILAIRKIPIRKYQIENTKLKLPN